MALRLSSVHHALVALSALSALQPLYGPWVWVWLWGWLLGCSWDAGWAPWLDAGALLALLALPCLQSPLSRALGAGKEDAVVALHPGFPGAFPGALAGVLAGALAGALEQWPLVLVSLAPWAMRGSPCQAAGCGHSAPLAAAPLPPLPVMQLLCLAALLAAAALSWSALPKQAGGLTAASPPAPHHCCRCRWRPTSQTPCGLSCGSGVRAWALQWPAGQTRCGLWAMIAPASAQAISSQSATPTWLLALIPAAVAAGHAAQTTLEQGRAGCRAGTAAILLAPQPQPAACRGVQRAHHHCVPPNHTSTLPCTARC